MNLSQSIVSRIDPRLSGLDERAGTIVAQAGISGAPVLLCWSFPLDSADLLPSMAEPVSGEFRFYWEQPGRDFALAAGGEAVSHQGHGGKRFEDAGVWADGVCASAITGTPDGATNPGPYLVGGFSFFEVLDEASWRGFDPARLVAPAWLALREGDSPRGMVQMKVEPGLSPEGLLAKAGGLLERFDHALRGRHPQEAGNNRAFKVKERRDGRENWIEIVRHARDRIRAGELTKVVLARALDLECETPPTPVVLLDRLRKTYPDCYNFLVDPGRGEMFLGSSPERMFRFSNGTVELAALAGTAPRGATPEADAMQARQLLESRKEREEHQIVVDGILASISSLGRVEHPEEPEVCKFSNLQHLYTPITLQPVKAVSPFTLLGRIHPTSAVGGHPQAEAFRLIRECESFDRGWYGAPLGWLNAHGEGEFAVALRTGTLSGQRMQLFAGGGIVAQSDPDREYEETQIKFQPLLSALGSE